MPAPTRPKRRWRVLAIAATACAALSAAAWGASVGTGYLSVDLWSEPSVGLTLRRGWVQLDVLRHFEGLPPPMTYYPNEVAGSAGWRPTWALFGWRRGGPASPNRSAWIFWHWVGVAPLWLPTAAGAVAAAAMWGIDASGRRPRAGLCPACGYDRAGLANAAPCPECGGTPAPATTTGR